MIVSILRATFIQGTLRWQGRTGTEGFEAVGLHSHAGCQLSGLKNRKKVDVSKIPASQAFLYGPVLGVLHWQ